LTDVTCLIFLREKGSYANHINDKIKQVEFENGQ